MAGKSQVTLTFAGDSSDLERSFDKVGSGAKDMGRDVGDSFDRVGSAADDLDTRAMGFRDSLTGVEDTSKGVAQIMEGDLFTGFLTLGMGIGDLASGVANFGVQFAKQAMSFVTNTATMVASHVAAVATTVAGWVTMGIQATVNAVKMAAAWLISLGPIGLVIAAIAAIIAILVALGIGFDDIKKVAGIVWDWIKDKTAAVWTAIKDGVSAVKDWIVDRFNAVKGFITGLPTAISNAASGMWDGIKTAFKTMINSIIGIWNGFRFPSKTFDVPSIKVAGRTLFGGGSFTVGGWSLPQIPYLHSGGVFEAPPGQREGLAMLLDGEKVTRPGAPAGPNVTVIVQGSIRSDRDLVEIIRDEIGRGGFGGAFA